MLIQQMVEVNLEWRDGFYTDDLDMSQVRKMEEEEEKEKKKEEDKQREEEKKHKGQDTIAKPKGKKKNNKVAKFEKKEDVPESSPELTKA